MVLIDLAAYLDCLFASMTSRCWQTVWSKLKERNIKPTKALGKEFLGWYSSHIVFEWHSFICG
jgi:hypothetical protein